MQRICILFTFLVTQWYKQTKQKNNISQSYHVRCAESWGELITIERISIIYANSPKLSLIIRYIIRNVQSNTIPFVPVVLILLSPFSGAVKQNKYIMFLGNYGCYEVWSLTKVIEPNTRHRKWRQSGKSQTHIFCNNRTVKSIFKSFRALEAAVEAIYCIFNVEITYLPSYHHWYLTVRKNLNEECFVVSSVTFGPTPSVHRAFLI